MIYGHIKALNRHWNIKVEYSNFGVIILLLSSNLHIIFMFVFIQTKEY